jgi:hypothetical protein
MLERRGAAIETAADGVEQILSVGARRTQSRRPSRRGASIPATARR